MWGCLIVGAGGCVLYFEGKEHIISPSVDLGAKGEISRAEAHADWGPARMDGVPHNFETQTHPSQTGKVPGLDLTCIEFMWAARSSSSVCTRPPQLWTGLVPGPVLFARVRCSTSMKRRPKHDASPFCPLPPFSPSHLATDFSFSANCAAGKVSRLFRRVRGLKGPGD